MPAAPQTVVQALSRIASKTGCTISRRAADDAGGYSLVAVCCASASVTSALRACSSLKRRTFSYRDDGLVREPGEEIDLLLPEGPHLEPVDHDSADRAAFIEQGYRQQRSDPDRPEYRVGMHGTRGVHQIGDMDEGTLEQRPPKIGPGNGSEGRPENRGDELRFCAALRPELEFFAIVQAERRKLRAAQASRLFQNRLEHRLQVRRRAADYLQDVRRRRLLLLRFRELAAEPESSSVSSRAEARAAVFPVRLPELEALMRGLRVAIVLYSAAGAW